MTFVSSLATQGLLELMYIVDETRQRCQITDDFSQYRAMLKELRRLEETFEDGSKIAYLLRLVYTRYSVICKMFQFGSRETETTDLICIFKSFIVKTSHFLPLGRFFFF